jgi:NADH dehydrogenase
MKKILVIGGGFAGLWSAVGAARKLRESAAQAEVTLVNRDGNHSIRVRNYEEDLTETLVPLPVVLDPIGVKLIIGEVSGIDTAQRCVTVTAEAAPQRIAYDKLIIASGSHLVRPPIPGLAAHSFDVDTYAAAMRLQAHISALSRAPRTPGRFTAVVIGSGATGVEIATELPARLRAAAIAGGSAASDVRVILADRQEKIAGQLGGAQAVIARACGALGIELLPKVSPVSITENEVVFNDGTRIPTSTVIWCGGMRASDLNACVAEQRDPQGRLFVDECLRVRGVEHVYAAGDAAHMLIDGQRPSVMSCQHARPMGRYAGHNAASELLGEPPRPLSIDWYTNIMDLGPWGAVYTEGWDRVVKAEGAIAKQTKTVINRERIYPPQNGDREQILAAATLDLQPPPPIRTAG